MNDVKKACRRHRQRWEDNIKMDPKEIVIWHRILINGWLLWTH